MPSHVVLVVFAGRVVVNERIVKVRPDRSFEVTHTTEAEVVLADGSVTYLPLERLAVAAGYASCGRRFSVPVARGAALVLLRNHEEPGDYSWCVGADVGELPPSPFS